MSAAITGFLDTVSGGRIAGWIVSDGSVEPRKAEILIDDVLIRTVRADQFRPDILKAGRHPTGACGFCLKLQSSVTSRLAAKVTVRVRDSESGIDLSRSPMVMTGGLAPKSFFEDSQWKMYGVNKDGELTIPFRNRSATDRRQTIKDISDMIETMAASNVVICLNGGSLLGAVRDGRLIEHDDDIDLMLIVDAEDIQEAQDKFSTCLRKISNAGYPIKMFSAGQAWVQKNRSTADMFLSWCDYTDRFFLNFAVAGEIDRSVIFPLKTISVEGIDVPCPNDPEAVCAAIYGPGWRTPDPLFAWKLPAKAQRLFSDLRIPINHNVPLWDSYYRSTNATQFKPSQFAAFVLERLDEGTRVAEFGCGSGSDACLFAMAGHRTVGFDYSPAAIDLAQATIKRLVDNRANCFCANLLDSSRCGELINSLLDGSNARTAVYSRLLLNATSKIGERAFLDLCAAITRLLDKVFIEVLVAGDAYRRSDDKMVIRPIDADDLIAALETRGFSLFEKSTFFDLRQSGAHGHLVRLVLERRW